MISWKKESSAYTRVISPIRFISSYKTSNIRSRARLVFLGNLGVFWMNRDSSSYKRSFSFFSLFALWITPPPHFLRLIQRTVSKGARSCARFNFHLFARHGRLQMRSGKWLNGSNLVSSAGTDSKRSPVSFWHDVIIFVARPNEQIRYLVNRK